MSESFKVEVGLSSDTRNCRRIHVNGAQWAKVYGWSEEEAIWRASIIQQALEQVTTLAQATNPQHKAKA